MLLIPTVQFLILRPNSRLVEKSDEMLENSDSKSTTSIVGILFLFSEFYPLQECNFILWVQIGVWWKIWWNYRIRGIQETPVCSNTLFDFPSKVKFAHFKSRIKILESKSGPLKNYLKFSNETPVSRILVFIFRNSTSSRRSQF